MKQTKTIALVLSFLFVAISTTVSFAVPKPSLPSFDLGIKAGANFSKLSGDEWESSMNPGFTGGAFIGLRAKKMGVQLEVLVNSAKYSGAGLFSGDDFKTTNLDIPILFQYKLLPMLSRSARLADRPVRRTLCPHQCGRGFSYSRNRFAGGGTAPDHGRFAFQRRGRNRRQPD